MKKVFRKRIAIILVSVSLISLVVLFLQENIFCLDDINAWRVRGFYLEDKDSLDVVFVGSSDVYADFSSALAYDEFGFTSYPFASDSATVALWKSQLEEIRKTQSPQLIVIEINGALYVENERLYDTGSMRKYLDSIPLSVSKLKTLHSLTLDEPLISYIVPFIKYHGELRNSLNVFKQSLYYRETGYARLRGFTTSTTKCTNNQFIDFSQSRNNRVALFETSEKLLRDVLQYCKDNDLVNIVFARFPHRFTSMPYVNRMYQGNEAERIIREYGYDFLNFETEYDKIGLNLMTDFYDDDHLNVYGVEKFTHYLSSILVNDYGVSAGNISERQKLEWADSISSTKSIIEKAKKLIENGENDVLSEQFLIFDYSCALPEKTDKKLTRKAE